MNVIFIVSDSLRADFLGCYGNSLVKTPSLDRFAHENVLFENCYTEGLRTIPERTIFLTGKFVMPFRHWEPLWETDIELSQILGKPGFWATRTLGKGEYTNAMITDVYHFWAPGMNFQRGFHSFRWIRGQEWDRYQTDFERADADPGKNFRPEWKVKEKGGLPNRPWTTLWQYAADNADRRSEEDYLPARVMKEGMEWLERNCNKKFFLYIDCFDPHGPYDPPEMYYKMYRDPRYDGPKLIYGVPVPDPSEEDLREVRALYSGEVTLVDNWVGELLRKVERLGLMENTLITFVSDHGVTFREKTSRGSAKSNYFRVPFLLHHPDEPRGKRIKQLIWTPDIMPTILSILNVEPPKTVHGKSFWPLVTGEKEVHREYAISGHCTPPTEPPAIITNIRRCVRTQDWLYIRDPSDGNELYNVKEDPQETVNVISEYPEKAKEMEGKLLRFRDETSKLKG